MMTLSAPARLRLIHLLGMLGSKFDGERANAGSLADQLVKKHRLTWKDIVASAPGGQGNHQQQQPRTWRDVVAGCQQQPDRLSTWECQFLNSIAAWRGSLTPKQAAKLAAIVERLGVEPAA